MERFNVIPFENTAIDFKEINHSDFEGYYFDEEEKTIITPVNGFISEPLLAEIDIHKKDTTIINASVGQGKTTAIIRLIEKYYKANEIDSNYIIVIAVPFKSLVDQYLKKIKDESGLDICFDYRVLDSVASKDSFPIFHDNPIQVISINAILGNPGKHAPKQAEQKREYYESLINYADNNGKKVIFIFDEIHESIHNFEDRFVFNLYKWNKVVHKIYVASATFNEASKVVIKYLAELTDKKIRIFETIRTQEIGRVSDLHIHLYDRYMYTIDDEIWEKLLLDETSQFDKVHILSYSKKLAKDIYDSDLMQSLEEKFGSFNLCTNKSKNDFEPKMNNIGTIFKTGVSIEDANCAYFIIMPPKSAYIGFTRGIERGIFANGIYNITQAFARPRLQSSVFVIMPSPDQLIMVPEIPTNYIKFTSLDYLPFDDEKYHSSFHSLNEQDNLLRAFFYQQKKNQSEGELFVESNTLELSPNFPDYDKYKLSAGEKNLSYYYQIFGKNLSNYVYWAAWNNQFVNCQLKTITKSSTLWFTAGSVQKELDKYYSMVFLKNSFFILNSDKDCYLKFRGSLFSNTIYFKDEEESEFKLISSYRNDYFEQQIITFIQRLKKQFNFDFNKLIYPPDGVIGNLNGPLDSKISKITYLRMAMLYSVDLIRVPQSMSTTEAQLINSYKRLYQFRDILMNEYSVKSKTGKIYLPIDKVINFNPLHQVELISIFDNLREYDKNLRAFSFLQKAKTLTPVYKLLKTLFFEVTIPSNIVTEEGKKMKANLAKLKTFPDHTKLINLIYSEDDPWLNQVGDGEVIEEVSEDPFYWYFE